MVEVGSEHSIAKKGSMVNVKVLEVDNDMGLVKVNVNGQDDWVAIGSLEPATAAKPEEPAQEAAEEPAAQEPAPVEPAPEEPKEAAVEEPAPEEPKEAAVEEPAPAVEEPAPVAEDAKEEPAPVAEDAKEEPAEKTVEELIEPFVGDAQQPTVEEMVKPFVGDEKEPAGDMKEPASEAEKAPVGDKKAPAVEAEKVGVVVEVKVGDKARLPKNSGFANVTVQKVEAQSGSVFISYDAKAFPDEWVVASSIVSHKRCEKENDGKGCILSWEHTDDCMFEPVKEEVEEAGEAGVAEDVVTTESQMREKHATDPVSKAVDEAIAEEEAPKPTPKEDTIHGHTMSHIRRVFNFFDKPLRGHIVEDDLAEAMRSLGLFVSNREAKKILVNADADQDGKISFEEFTEFLRNRPKDSEDRLRSAFRRFDANGDGNIDLNELKKALTSKGEKLTEAEVDEMFKEFSGMDENGDGQVDFEEFLAALIGK